MPWLERGEGVRPLRVVVVQGKLVAGLQPAASEDLRIDPAIPMSAVS